MAKQSKGASAAWTKQIRKVLLAGVGAVVLAQEEVEDFVEKLVKKGEVAEKDGKKLLSDILDKQNKAVSSVTKTVKSEVVSLEHELQGRIETMLHKVKLASKKDVDKLASKIDSLSKVVDRLSKNKRAN